MLTTIISQLILYQESWTVRSVISEYKLFLSKESKNICMLSLYALLILVKHLKFLGNQLSDKHNIFCNHTLENGYDIWNL